MENTVESRIAFVKDVLNRATGQDAVFDIKTYVSGIREPDDFTDACIGISSSKCSDKRLEVSLDQDGNLGIGVLISSESNRVYAWGFEPTNLSTSLLEQLVRQIWNGNTSVALRKPRLLFRHELGFLIPQRFDELADASESQNLAKLRILDRALGFFWKVTHIEAW